MPAEPFHDDFINVFTGDDGKQFDPYSTIQSNQGANYILKVKVLSGRDITSGIVADMIDTPDPYVILQLSGDPKQRKRTKCILNNRTPVWNEEFVFYLNNAQLDCKLLVTLMDSNVLSDAVIGKSEINIKEMLLKLEEKRVLKFKNGSKVAVKTMLAESTESTYRYSLALNINEKAFIRRRKKHVLLAMRKVLINNPPRNVKELPVVALLGSGGGVRAMVGFYGAISALFDSGLLDVILYIATLSGSSWMLSWLYTHPDFPQKKPSGLRKELSEHLSQSWLKPLTPSGITNLSSKVGQKKQKGQPTSLTDIYGYLLGEFFMKDKMTTKLSNQQEKIDKCMLPFPLYCCLSVRKDVSAEVFHEWLEFTPYEVYIPKYGIGIPLSCFGSKMHAGHALEKSEEFPLHFMLAIWSNAFAILFDRLVKESLAPETPGGVEEQAFREYCYLEETVKSEFESFNNFGGTPSTSSILGETSKSETSRNQPSSSNSSGEVCLEKAGKPLDKSQETSFWSGVLCNLVKNMSFISSRAIRAGVIHNPLRGLDLQKSFDYSPLTGNLNNIESILRIDKQESKEGCCQCFCNCLTCKCSKCKEKSEKKHPQLYDIVADDEKKFYLVDAALAFNLPFPLLLRPQRGVDIVISYDFSWRNKDDPAFFQELIRVEDWARKSRAKFPPIKRQAEKYKKEPVKECYVFSDPEDPYCPVILHFIVYNGKFREYVTPDTRRTKKDDRKFSDFDVYSDPKRPYWTFKMQYTELEFERLFKLMEFNTLDHVELIKSHISEIVKRNQEMGQRHRECASRWRNVSHHALRSKHRLRFC